MAVIPARGDVAEGTPQLEFYVSNGSGEEVDKPAWGDTYRCSCPGGFKLQHGRLRPFPRARAAPTMLACPPFLVGSRIIAVYICFAGAYKSDHRQPLP